MHETNSITNIIIVFVLLLFQILHDDHLAKVLL